MVTSWQFPVFVGTCQNMLTATFDQPSTSKTSSKHLNKHLHSVDLLKQQQRDFSVYPILLGPLKLCGHHFWEFELSVMWRFHVSIGKRPVGESPTSLLCGVQFTPTNVSRKYGWFSLWKVCVSTFRPWAWNIYLSKGRKLFNWKPFTEQPSFYVW